VQASWRVVSNKPQNLLVTFESTGHVKIILSDAKQLRKFQNTIVRDNVFINADLTKALFVCLLFNGTSAQKGH